MITAAITGLVVAAAVYLANSPAWAAVGFGLIAYLQANHIIQDHARTLALAALLKAKHQQ